MLAIRLLRPVYSAHLQLELWINPPILWKTLHRLWINLWNDSTDLVTIQPPPIDVGDFSAVFG